MFAQESYPILRRVYPNTSASSRRSKAVREEIGRFLAKLERFSLGCMPMLPQEGSPFFKNKWVWRLVSELVFSFHYASYARVCEDDLAHTLDLMASIADASEERWPLEVKAFMLHHLLSHVIAYRQSDYFFKHPERSIPLPVRVHEEVKIKNCQFDREINLFGGVMVKVFIPRDGHGSATYAFCGTTPWLCADGAGITLLDDFNPIGPGEGLRIAARKRLVNHLKQHLRQLDEPAIAVGHSLGAVLAIYLAVDLPHFVRHAVGFNPTRPSHNVAGQWASLQHLLDRALSAGAVTPHELLEEWRRIRQTHHGEHLPKLPQIDTFISHFADHWDIVSYVGARWIGNVHRVHSKHEADFIQRHLMPTGSSLDGVAEVSRLDIDAANDSLLRRTRWYVVCHALVVFPIAMIILILLLTKRLFFGWNQGGAWRYGIFGAFYHWLSSFFHPNPL